MFKITKALVEHAVESLGLDRANEGDEAAVRDCVVKAINDGKLKFEKLTELTTDSVSAVEKKIGDAVAAQVGPVAAQVAALAELVKSFATQPAGDGATVAPTVQPTNDAPNGAKAMAAAAQVASTDTDDVQIRIKSVKERYNTANAVLSYTDTKAAKGIGAKPVMTKGEGTVNRAVTQPSEFDLAIAGVTALKMAQNAYRRSGRPVPQNLQDTPETKSLWEYAAHECKWVGPVGGVDEDSDASPRFGWSKGKLDGLQTKAVLDDATSGGLEAVPIEFDSLAILTPLLQGELYPLVDERVVTRRRIEGFSMGNPTLAWGVAEGSEVALFSTTSFIAAFDTVIYPVAGAIEIGLDFLADSPVQIGQLIMNSFGNRFRQEMDNVIAAGSGTARPLGIIETVSAVSVDASDNPNGPTITDAELLLFGVAKEYRQEATAARSVFLSNETVYQQLRSTPVDATDARRIFGMDHESYQILGHRYCINEDAAMTDDIMAFACLNRYRLYRRAGFGMRIVTEDQSLARKNQEMLMVRARFGGGMDNANAVALIDDLTASSGA